MKTLKKLICLLLALVMTLSIVACGNQANADPTNGGATNAPTDSVAPTAPTEEIVEIGTDPITISVSGAQGATDDWNGTLLVESMKEMFNVTMDCTPYADDMWQNKFALMLAEDDLPDLITAISDYVTLADVHEYGEQGYFLAIDEYLEYAPNLAKFLEEHPDYAMYCTSPDGHIYTLVTYSEDPYANLPRNFINKTWLDNLELENPTTLDELYNVLVAFKEQDANGNGDRNDEIPIMFAGTYARNVLQTLLPAFGINAGHGTQAMNYLLQADESGKVYLADTTENFKAYLTYVHKLYEEELLYNASYSTEIAQQRELTKTDRVGVFADAGAHVATGNGDVKDYQYFELFGAFTSEYQSTPTLVNATKAGSSPKVLISADTEHPERIIQMLDYFFSEEGLLAGQYGVDGCLYENCTIDGFTDLTMIAQPDAPEGYESSEVYRHKKQVINNAFNFVTPLAGTNHDLAYSGDQSKLMNLITEGTGAVWGACAQIRINEQGINVVDAFPALIYGSDVLEQRTSLYTDLSAYLATAHAQFITGELDIEKDWDAYVAECEKMGLADLLEIEQAAYDDLMGK